MESRSNSQGLPGLVTTAWPAPGPSYGVAATTEYGYTESVDGAGDGAHHRVGGRVAVGATPKWAPWLSAALTFDGRLDVHPDDGMGDHVTGVGDPRLVLRGGHALNDEWRLGADATVWVPGESAPSIKLSATTADLRLLGTYDRKDAAWSLLAAAGYRLDHSAGASLPLERVRSSDRLGLGLSDFDAVLVALGVAYDLPGDTQLYAEASMDLLVGGGAPPVSESPIRLSVGARHPLTDSLTGEVVATVSLSQRPPISPDDPLVPIEPRFSLGAGLRFGRSLIPPPEPEPEPAPQVEPAPTSSSVRGQLLDAEGQPLPDAMVTLTPSEGPPRQRLTDAQGRYRFDDVPLGPAELHVKTVGFDEQRWTVQVGAEPTVQAPRALTVGKPEGTLRGLTRSFNSDPVAAQIVVTGPRGRVVQRVRSGEDGEFELQLPPGRFQVQIRARGYRSQRRTIEIYDKSVTVLNVDLREQK